MKQPRKSYPSDVSDEEWAFCVRYLTLMTAAAAPRVCPLREIFNGLRYLVRMGGVWRMDTLGHLLALSVTPANEQDRAQVGQLAQAIQAVVAEPVQVAFVDQGYTGEQPAAAAAQAGLQLEVAKHHEA